MRVCAVVPSLNPDDNLLEVVSGLISREFERIIVVNDGSNDETSHYFETIKSMPGCVVLRHNKNLGKGRALKTAFNYYLNHYSDMMGLVVADGDNQHHIDDIVNCANKMVETGDSLVLGCRNFSKQDIPLRSRFGNKLTVVLMKVLCGIKVSDTQTGLRAIPTDMVREFLGIYGERYEYETNMLLETKRQDIDIIEVGIQTIYIDDNKSSHFNPITDSSSIYKLIFKFIWASFASMLIDLGLFTLIEVNLRNSGLSLSESILISTVSARVISSFCNFLINRKVVFNNKQRLRSTVFKYYTVCIIQMFASYGGVLLFTSVIRMSPLVSKIIVDTLLFFVSFQIQREWVFKKKKV